MADENDIKTFEPGSGRAKRPNVYEQPKKFQIKLNKSDDDSADINNDIPFSEKSEIKKKPKKKMKKGKIIALVAFVIVIGLLIWPIHLLFWANGQIKHLKAIPKTHIATLSTSGTTYLIAGSDRRIKGYGPQDFENGGARSDTVMLLHKPEHGNISLMSIPRDTYVKIPGHSANKINAAFSIGGPTLLVKTVEKLTGMQIDHYIELNFEGLIDVVNAVNGIHVCLKYNVNDPKSGLKWKKGCHTINGKKALAFARMRYSDPRGDFGREERQQEVIHAIIDKANDFPAILLPSRQEPLIKGALGGLFFNDGTNIFDVIKMALAFKDVAVRGLPSVKNPGYFVPGVGSAVQLDPKKSKKDFQAIINGYWKPKKQKI
jgi:LCP family protein required for cell wall assembly